MMRIDLRLDTAHDGATAAGSGFLALDLIETAPASGKYHSAAGGTCGNVLSILTWLGWTGVPVARIGLDEPGDHVIDALRDIGVDVACIRRDPSTPTPIVIQRTKVDARGVRVHRFSMSCPECGQWLPQFRPIVRTDADLGRTHLGRAPSVFFFDRVAPGILELARWARAGGALVMFEPSSHADDRPFQEAIEVSHILKYSHERLGHVRDLGANKHSAVVIETLGEEGLSIRWKGYWTRFDSFAAPRFVDAAGAGDWCTAGFLHVIGQRGAESLKAIRKPQIERAIRIGQGLSALNCGYEGARGLMRGLSRKDASRMLGLLQGGEGTLPDALDHDERTVTICGVCRPPTIKKSRLRSA